jgi:glycosyltransferase involved in cell wall biosynthesis
MASERTSVLLLITELDRGGAERVVVDLAASIDRTRFDVTVATLWPGGDLANEILARGTAVVSLGSGRSRDPRLVMSLGRMLAHGRFDVVHSHLALAGLVARVALQAHRSIADVYTEHNVPSTYTRAARVLSCLSLDLPQEVVAVSAEVQRSWAKLRFRRSRGSVLVRNGVFVPEEPRNEDARRRVRAALGLRDETPVVVTVANLYPRKGQRLLLEAFAGVASHEPPHLIIVGEGPLRGQLEAIATDLGIFGRTMFLGTRRDVPEILHAADVFALPSVAEGLPLALLEAMARGVPCIATRVGGIPEVIVDGESGYLVSAGNVAELRARLAQLLDSPALQLRVGRAGRERTLAHFQVSGMTRAYERIYEQALRQRRSREQWQDGVTVQSFRR